MNKLKNKIILITGGSGFWGQELTKQLLEKYNPKEIRIFSRGEEKQVNMKRNFNDKRLKFIIGDVRSLNRLNEAMKNVNIVFHLAALKCINIAEDNPWESVHTNIIGVENIIRASISNNVEIVCDSSTDKAANPMNNYGACKSVGEKLMINANKRDGNTRFVCIRAGNVAGSTNSVIPFFENLSIKGKELPITDINMTRYFIPVKGIVELMFKAVKSFHGGEIMVVKMRAANLLDLATVIWENHNDTDLKYKIIGVINEEKKHEMLVSEHESTHTVEDGNFRIILPTDKSLNKYYKKYNKMKEVTFTSDQVIMTKLEIKKLLKEAGY